MSFRCEHCGTQNNEVQSAGTIRGILHTLMIEECLLSIYLPSDHGTAYTVCILSREDLDRQLVKSPTCTVIIPEYELTIPPSKGQLTTVEGLLRNIVADLGADQPLRRIENEDAYKKIQSLLDAFKDIIGDDGDEEENAGPVKKSDEKTHLPLKPFTVKLDDPAGNSFVEFVGSMSDPKWNLRTYKRTKEQNVELGLVAADGEAEDSEKDGSGPTRLTNSDQADDVLGGGFDQGNEEIFIFPGTCSSCGAPLDTLMKKVNIPYFKVSDNFPHSVIYINTSD